VLAHGGGKKWSAHHGGGKLTVQSATNGCDGSVRFLHSGSLVLHRRDGRDVWTEGRRSKRDGNGLGDLSGRQREGKGRGDGGKEEGGGGHEELHGWL